MDGVALSRLPLFEVTPSEVRARRVRNNWSLQDLANHSGINKAYLSEFENGKRLLPDAQLHAIDEAFTRFRPAGRARPTLTVIDGHWRLVFIDEHGNEVSRPTTAHLTWTESDGTSYSMFVGDHDD